MKYTFCKIEKFRMSAVFAVATLLALTGARAEDTLRCFPQGIPAPAAPVQKRIPVGISMLKAEDRNGDYLNGVSAPPPAPSLNAQLFDKAILDEMSSKYNALLTNYDRRRTYRLDRMEDQMQFESGNKDLVDWTMKRMLQFHAENSVKKAPKDTAAGKTVGTAAATMKALQNSTMNFGEDTKARFKYDLPHGTMSLGVTSPLVNTSMNYKVSSLTHSTGDAETLTVGMDKQIKPLQTSTSARYGVVSQTMNYGLNKHLAGPLSAGVDQYRDLRDPGRDEVVGRLNFGTSF